MFRTNYEDPRKEKTDVAGAEAVGTNWVQEPEQKQQERLERRGLQAAKLEKECEE